MDDNAVLCCSSGYFDCRFSISLLSGDGKVVMQVCGTLASGREGQDGLVARSCTTEFIFKVLIHTHSRIILGVFPCIYIVRGMTPVDETESCGDQLIFSDRGCAYLPCVSQPAAKHGVLYPKEWFVNFLGNPRTVGNMRLQRC